MTLREFLSNLANAFRTYLDTTDKINAQNFADKVGEVFEKGKAQGGGGDPKSNPLYYMVMKASQWEGVVFPEGFNLVAEFINAPTALSSVFSETKGVHLVKLVCKENVTIPFNRFARASEIRVIDLTEFKPIPTTIDLFVYNNPNIVSILGKLNLSSCTNVNNAFGLANSLEDVDFEENSIMKSIAFNNCPLLTAKSLNNIMLGLAPTVTGQTLTLPAYETVKATYDDVSAYGEGAWDILTASKTNWTIAYR